MKTLTENPATQSNFMPHGYCFSWDTNLLWLNLGSDILTALAYYLIAGFLVYFVFVRRDVPFNWIFVLFGLFIFTCGTTHLMSAWTVYVPSYWTEGGVKALNASVSILTAMLLFPLIPKLIALPSLQKAFDENANLNRMLQLKVTDLQNEMGRRKQAEEELLQFKHIVSTSTDMMALLDKDFIYRAANPAYLDAFNKAPDEFIGHSVSEVFGEEFFNDVIRPYAELCLAGEKINYQEWFNFPTYETMYMDINYYPYFGSGNEIVGFIVNARDITKRKKAETELEKHHAHLEEIVDERTKALSTKAKKLKKESGKLEKSEKTLRFLLTDVNEIRLDLEKANKQLQELDKLKSMFIASMSHELRTPLNSIIGFSGVLLQGMDGKLNTQQIDHLSRVKRSAIHLLTLISDVIDISKVEAGKIVAYTDKFMLHEVVDETVSGLELQIKHKGLELEVTIPPLELYTDRKRLLQCLLNYVSNAMKFTEAGKITISAVEEDDMVVVNVKDSGIGIREKDLPRLYTQFTRIDSPLARKTLGTGLGLYLTKKLAVEVLQGEAFAESIYGKGSTFSIRIPKQIEVAKAGGE